ncbi:MAG TPA: AAA family ATPase [Thermoplasmata archaeon]|nr:AAA family ATPase [Thermoplasmata archaeon]
MDGARPPFIGRLATVDALQRRGDAAATGRGGLTLVVGDGGVGKSLLLDRCAGEARRRGLKVLQGRAEGGDAGPPFLVLRRALESLRPDDETALPGDRAPLAFAATGSAAPALLGFAAGAAADDPGSRAVESRLLEVLGEPVGRSPGGTGGRAATLAAEFLELADRAPTALLLDDLHLADAPSLEALLEIAPRLSRHPLWIVATLLPFEALDDDRRSRLESIATAADAETVALGPFTAADVAAYVRAVHPELPVDDAATTRWLSQSGGNPSFLERILGVETRGGAPEAAGEPGREGPAEFVRRQLAGVTEEERRVLAVAAILGRSFPFALLVRAAGAEEERLAETVQRLVDRGLLRETADERVEFPSEAIRTTLDASLTEAHRRLLHRRAAAGLSALGPENESAVYALARHYHLGKVDDRAVLYNRRAGELAANAAAPGVARLHFERALESARRIDPHGATTLELELELALQLDRLGELAAAEKLLASARDEFADRPGIPAGHKTLLAIYLARIVSDQGRWDEADRLTEELLRTGPALTDYGELAIHRLRGEMRYFQGRYDESLHHHDAALAIARTMRNDREVAREMVRRANVLGMIPGRLDEAIEAYRFGSDALKALGDPAEAGYALLYLGVVLAQHGRLAESLAQLTESARLAEAARDPRRLGWALFNAADVEREMGEIDRARESNRRAREILGHVGDRMGLLETHIVEGKIDLADGALDAAELELLEAYRLVRDLGTPADELEVILRLAELAERRGDRASARSRLGELAGRDVPRLRPDLVPDLDRLARRIAPGEGGTADAAAP